jgi:hypothetical protein
MDTQVHEQTVSLPHPFFALALHRAVKVKERAGELSHEAADQAYEAILRPHRKDEAGRTCHLMDALRGKVTELAQADAVAFKGATGESAFDLTLPTFDWTKIWTWIKANLPTILSALASLISIFMLFA